jgi:hypothetical protein
MYFTRLKTKSPRYQWLWNAGFGTVGIRKSLSSRSPLARDVGQATRSVMRTLTAHFLATGIHEIVEYLSGGLFVKQPSLQSLDASNWKK